MLKEIVKEALFPFSMIVLAMIPIGGIVFGIVLIVDYLTYTFNDIVGLSVGGVLVILLTFVLIVAAEYIPSKYEERKAKRSNVSE